MPTQQNRLIAALSEADAADVARNSSNVSFAKGELIYEAGDVIERVYFPVEGIAALMIAMENGATAEATSIGREGLIGFVAALGSERSIARICCQSPIRAVALPLERLERFVDERPAFRQLLLCYTEALVASLLQSAACNALHPVEARFARWLLTTHDRTDGNVLELTQEYLAEMLGVQRTTVTMVAQSLQNAGLIRYRRGTVTIVDRTRLEAASCECYGVVRRHFERLLPKTYTRPRVAPQAASV